MTKLKIGQILVPVDFSDTSRNALKQAVTIAKVAKARIKIIHVVADVYIPSDPPMPDTDPIIKTIIKRAGSELQKIVKEIKSEGAIDISFEIKSGSATDTICAVAEQEKFDLIVMGTHGVSGIKEFFAGSNAYKVVHHSTCPVLTIQKGSPSINLKTILLPIRLEKSSRQKVDYVVDLARLFGSTILITGFTDEKAESKQYKIKQYVAQVERYLAKMDINYKSKLIFAPNFIKEILKYAQKSNAGLIVAMKEHDFSIDQLLKGRYAEQFVNHSPTPVLSIPVFSNPDLIAYDPYLSGDTPY